MRVIFKWFIALLLVILLSSGLYWLYFEYNLQPNQSNNQSGSPHINWIMHQATIKLTNKQGKIVAIIHSSQSHHQSQKNIIALQKPRAELFNQDSSHWHIQANQGYIDQNHQDITYLSGQVILHRHANSEKPAITLLTNNLTYNPKTDQAYTKQPVIILQPNAIVHSKGLRANLKTQKVQLYHESEVKFAHVAS